MFDIQNRVQNATNINQLSPILRCIIQALIKTPMLEPLNKLHEYKLQMKQYIIGVNQNQSQNNQKPRKRSNKNKKNKRDLVENELESHLSGIFSLYKIRQRVSDHIYSSFEQFVIDLKHLQQFCWQIDTDVNNNSNSSNRLKRAVSLIGKQLELIAHPYMQQLKILEPNCTKTIKLKRKPPF
jgi:hypothetical protein